MGKRTTVGARRLRQLLGESAEVGDFLKLVLEERDPNYLELTAISLVREARLHLPDRDAYHSKIRQAVTLLASARAMRDEAPQETR